MMRHTTGKEKTDRLDIPEDRIDGTESGGFDGPACCLDRDRHGRRVFGKERRSGYSALNSNVSVLVRTISRPDPSCFPSVEKKTAPSVDSPGAILTCTSAIAEAAAAAFSLAEDTKASAACRRCS